MTGSIVMPTANIAKPASIDAVAPLPDSARPIAPPRWRNSTDRSGDADLAPATSTTFSIPAGVRSRSSMWSPLPGTGFGGSMCSSWRPVAGIVANVSISGPSLRSGFRSLDARSSSMIIAASTTTRRRPRSGSGMAGRGGPRSKRPTEGGPRGHRQQTADRGDLVGNRVDPLAPRGQHFLGALHREDQPAGVQLLDRVQA